jgi:hypothetical protein
MWSFNKLFLAGPWRRHWKGFKAFPPIPPPDDLLKDDS